MKDCGYEEAVMMAVRRGQWSDELLEHRESCLVCAEVTLVASLLIKDAQSLPMNPTRVQITAIESWGEYALS